MSEDFDEKSFWDKVSGYARLAGREVIEKSLWLYYAAQSPRTPKWAKSVIYGALAYFVLPVDAIPDLIPLVGFTDDLGALAAAVASVAMYIDDDVKEKTRLKMAVWFDNHHRPRA
jgi:uncharacterized membrane protein YkvA (DUF1232 family)